MTLANAGLPLTVAVRRVVKPGCETTFEQLMSSFIDASSHIPGSGDFQVFRPGPPSSREYLVLHRFADEAARRVFVDASQYREWMALLREVCEEEPKLEEVQGLAPWFTLPGRPMQVPPPRHRMALVTFLGVYPLTSLLPPLFGRLLPWHPLLVNVFTTGTIVAALTWLLMPVLTRLFAPWLFSSDSDSRRGAA